MVSDISYNFCLSLFIFLLSTFYIQRFWPNSNFVIPHCTLPLILTNCCELYVLFESIFFFVFFICLFSLQSSDWLSAAVQMLFLKSTPRSFSSFHCVTCFRILIFYPLTYSSGFIHHTTFNHCTLCDQSRTFKNPPVSPNSS